MFLSAIQKCCNTFACTSALAAGTTACPSSHLQSDSVSFDQCHSIGASLETKLPFKKSSHDLQIGRLKSPVTRDFPDYPENGKSRILEENSEHPEKQDVAQISSRREFYLRENEIKMARSTGIGIGDERLETYLMNALLSKSLDGSTLNGTNIAMFDLHSRRFADLLLNAGVSGLSIVETSQHEAQKAKVLLLS
uniref:AMP-binding domain-containing protein n=1 Tax=Elaeophora elaphi TaxID=1147741 RepID=A0A0R3RYN6_9BILA